MYNVVVLVWELFNRSQSDYFQATRGGGNGDYNTIVLAPASVQEMADFVDLAFTLAFKYRNPGNDSQRWCYRSDDGEGGAATVPSTPYRRTDSQGMSMGNNWSYERPSTEYS
jgi:hypothetical protein